MMFLGWLQLDPCTDIKTMAIRVWNWLVLHSVIFSTDPGEWPPSNSTSKEGATGKSEPLSEAQVVTENRPASGRELVRQLSHCISGWQRPLATAELAGRQPQQRVSQKPSWVCVCGCVCQRKRERVLTSNSILPVSPKDRFVPLNVSFFYIIVNVWDSGKREIRKQPKNPVFKRAWANSQHFVNGSF